MEIKNFFIKHTLLFSFILTIFMVFLVSFFQIPNPNVILLTVIVYLSFLGGLRCGILSGFIIIVYSIYFFSIPSHFGIFSAENLKKVIVIIVFVPIMVYIVGTLKKQYDLKTKELELVNEELKRISRIDSLTGIPNRRYFDEVFLDEYNRAILEQTHLSLLMIDVDFFKRYNDNYGHVSGDNCLKLIAQAISNEVYRPGDFVARYGGEEFVVLLPNTDDKGAMFIANKIIQSVFSFKMPHCSSEICGYVTVSIGATTMNNFEERNVLEFIESADKALYLAKNNGRNQVYYFENNII
jgi:diguanylate cyclase (GGDEF)-like protein